MAEPKPLASLSAGLLARKGAARPAMRRQTAIGSHFSGHDDLGWNDMGYDVDPHDAAEVQGRVVGHGLSPLPSYGQSDGEEDAMRALGDAVDRAMAPVVNGHAAVDQFALQSTVQPLTPDADFDAERIDQIEVPQVRLQQKRLALELTPADHADAQAQRDDEARTGEQFAADQRAVEDARQVESRAEVAAPSPAPVAVAAPVNVPAVARAPRTTPVRAPSEAAPRSRAGSRGSFAFTLRLDPERHLRLRLASATTNRSAQQILIALVDDYFANQPEIDAFAAQLPASNSRN